jgi:hypothetical protein
VCVIRLNATTYKTSNKSSNVNIALCTYILIQIVALLAGKLYSRRNFLLANQFIKHSLSSY